MQQYQVQTNSIDSQGNKCAFMSTSVSCGCRYCQPQAYIDRMEAELLELEEEIRRRSV